MFTCPTCKIQLDKIKGSSGVLWCCSSCKGRTSTVSLLRKNISSEVVNELWQAARSGNYEGKRPCPSCYKPMAEIPVKGVHKTEYLDICTSCQFLWFDYKEFEALPLKQQKTNT